MKAVLLRLVAGILIVVVSSMPAMADPLMVSIPAYTVFCPSVESFQQMMTTQPVSFSVPFVSVGVPVLVPVEGAPGAAPAQGTPPRQITANDAKAFLSMQAATAQAREELMNTFNRIFRETQGFLGPAAIRAEIQNFQNDLNSFEARACNEELSANQVNATYREITRLLTAKNPTIDKANDSSITRVSVAEQIINHAADPRAINQGRHPTCNVTAVEVRLFTRQPDKVAKLIVDASITGTYQYGDNKQVRLTNLDLTPSKDDELYAPYSNQGGRDLRSHASQIAQIVMINIAKDHDSTYSYHRREVPAGADPKDRGASADEGLFCDGRWLGDSPALGTNSFKYIYNKVTGGNDTNFILQYGDAERPLSYGAYEVNTPEKLKQTLTTMKNDKKFPAIVRVHTRAEPFWTDSGAGIAGGAGGDQGGWHVVTISDFDPKTGLISVDNQWGDSRDHLSGDRRLAVRDLLNSMRWQDRQASAQSAVGTTPLFDLYNAGDMKLVLIGDGANTKACTLHIFDINSGQTVTQLLNTVCISTKTHQPPPTEAIGQKQGLQFGMQSKAPQPIANIYNASKDLSASGQYHTALDPSEQQGIIAQLSIWKYTGNLSGDPKNLITQEVIKNDLLKGGNVDPKTLTPQQLQQVNQGVDQIFEAVDLTMKRGGGS